MRTGFAALGLAFIAISAPLCAGTRDVQYAQAPTWVLPPPTPTLNAAPEGGPFRVTYNDTQVRFTDKGTETYSAYRLKILAPEALDAGKISLTWNPDGGEATVHLINIIRDDKRIDVLATDKFLVIQREEGLEASMLDGQLTATMQIPGLRVGDEIEFAITIRQRDKTLGNHFFGAGQLPISELPGSFRIRVNWPQERPVKWEATPDLVGLKAATNSGRVELAYELRDPKSAVFTDGAPPRFNVRRYLEYSDFSSWSEVSQKFWPLFDEASRLSAGSPVLAEAAKIAAATQDPAERAMAALKLVESQVRYVYVGLDAGNYRPAPADETWNRRFGDCKAKTALLLALLRELGVPAEAMLVNTVANDGMNERLPTPAVFNHVLVRIRIGSQSYWLDGTGLGDQYLNLLPRPAYRWALPVRPELVELEPIVAVPPPVPQFVTVLDIDASSGFDRAAKISAQNILRGDGVYQLRTKLAGMSTADAERALKGYWKENASFVDPETVSWRYSNKQAALVISLVGTGKLDWEVDDDGRHTLTIMGAGFYAPDSLKRPAEQDQSAPWVTDFPRFKCWATTVRLPAAKPTRIWDYQADPVDVRLGGVAYWRDASLANGTITTVMSRRVYKPEISAKEARLLNGSIETFDNNMSQVFETPSKEGKFKNSVALPPTSEVDWVSPDAPCASPVHL
ncbi:MAG: DUF3857 domain-containing protein [Sphingomonadales bacterium]|nr:DUF3857 domain-containing protein [Sphingomonadales bacterium]